MNLLQILTELPGLLLALEKAQVQAQPQERISFLLQFLTALMPGEEQGQMQTKLGPFVSQAVRIFEATQAFRNAMHPGSMPTPIDPAVPTNMIDPSVPLPAAVMAAQVNR